VSDGVWRTLVLLLLVAAALQAVILIAVMRRLGSVAVQLRAATVNDRADGPEIGRVVRIPGVSHRRPVLAVFLSPTCGMCRDLLSAVPVVAHSYQQIDVLAVVTGEDQGEREAYAHEIGELGRSDLFELERAWNIGGTPFAVGIDHEGRVTVRGVVTSLDELKTVAVVLAEGVLKDESSNTAPRQKQSTDAGRAAPPITSDSDRREPDGRAAVNEEGIPTHLDGGLESRMRRLATREDGRSHPTTVGEGQRFQ
jgi:hypothetical protein